MNTTTRWINRSLPQLLYFSSILLYFEAGSAVLSMVTRFLGGSAYYFVEFFIQDRASIDGSGGGTTKLIVLLAAGAYVYAGWGIANEKKVGWIVGVVVSVVAVILPFAAVGFSILSSGYIITLMFNIALVALLVHPQSRDYQKIWFK